ncbi:MAG: hypothetical protein QM762_13500 [Chryseolinea sp.]
MVSLNGDFWAIPIDLAINDPNNRKFVGADNYMRSYLRHKINDAWTFNAQAAYMTTDWDDIYTQPRRRFSNEGHLVSRRFFHGLVGKADQYTALHGWKI